MIDWALAASLMFGGVLLFLGIGMPVAFAFFCINIVGVVVFMGGLAGIDQMIANATDAVTTFTLAPVPLFVIMGELFFHTGLAMRVFDALDKWMGNIRGRLTYLTIGGGTLFAALSGSSLANTALLGALMVPEMLKRGYKPYIINGPILSTGGLAMIIPPSSLAVLLASLARLDVGALLMAGVIPGVILAGMYVAMVRIQLALDPDAAPAYDVPRASWGEKIQALVVNVLPMGLVVFAVIGLILLGWATPSEAAAFGTVSVVVLAILYRCLTWTAIVRSMKGALAVTAMTFFILLGSTTFSQIVAYTGATTSIIKIALGYDLSPYMLLLLMLLALLVLGMFMDQLSMMMLTIPIFFPLIIQLGFEPIWFGLVMLLALELSLATPPFGLLLFIMVGVGPPGTRLGAVALAAMPYIGCTLLLILILTAFPGIALWLPNHIAK
ncbi:TRAP transporter large permease [Prosthecomicrobium hirschii]|uniref:TRAP transporter large permease n=1 Tax=Prosthecodimorpha hirschii TaxID=665126 RepID=UPI000AD68C48|nr:TRAP transporter large permease [Prosthecomicrobium hirschii]